MFLSVLIGMTTVALIIGSLMAKLVANASNYVCLFGLFLANILIFTDGMFQIAFVVFSELYLCLLLEKIERALTEKRKNTVKKTKN